MGIHDRDYMRSSAPPAVSLPRSWTVRFLILLVVMFVVTAGAKGWYRFPLLSHLALSWEALREGRVWTLLTSALVHADAMHLIVNGIGLWFFGRMAESELGPTRFAWFCLLTAVLSHVPFVVVSATTGDAWVSTVGASGVVLACVVYAAFRFPFVTVYMIFIPMRLWQLAVLYVILDVFGAARGAVGIDHLTHLGGAVCGFAAHRWGTSLPGFLPRRRPPRPATRAAPRGPDERERVDQLLDKIAQKGIGSLTREERAFLEQSSKRYR